LFDTSNGSWITEERTEEYYRIYLDWTPSPRFAVHTELVRDNYRSEQGILTADANLPEKLVTWSLPVAVSYFDPSGFFAGLGATYVDQLVVRSPGGNSGPGG